MIYQSIGINWVHYLHGTPDEASHSIKVERDYRLHKYENDIHPTDTQTAEWNRDELRMPGVRPYKLVRS